MGGRWYLFFSVAHNRYSDAHLAQAGVKRQNGTHYMVSDHPFGPFRYLCDDFLVGDEIDTLYSDKLIYNPKEDWVYMAFRLFTSGTQFAGEIVDPMPLEVVSDGQLNDTQKPI